jgi:hypothetical protein
MLLDKSLEITACMKHPRVLECKNGGRKGKKERDQFPSQTNEIVVRYELKWHPHQTRQKASDYWEKRA